MPAYDFHQLSPDDLVILARDLLQAHWGLRLESFKTGRDGGVDLRHASGPNKIIVRVKQFLRTGLSGLLRELKVEAVKVRRLQPTHYALVTSVPLSPANKATIAALMPTGVLAPADIVGAEDLNNLLELPPTSKPSIISSGSPAGPYLREAWRTSQEDRAQVVLVAPSALSRTSLNNSSPVLGQRVQGPSVRV